MKKINIIFLVNIASVFNSVKSVYLAAKNNKNINPIILCINKDKEVYRFCLSIDKNAIWAYNDKKNEWIEPKKLKPDFIFLSQPYKWDYPELYQLEKLKNIAKICYIPYGFLLTKELVEFTTTWELLQNTHYIFADQQETCDEIQRKSSLIKKSKIQSFNIGYARFDLYQDCDIYNGQVRKILYLPRWVFHSDGMEQSNFLEYKDSILDYAENHSDLEIIIRPHPNMFRSIIELNIMTKQEVQQYYDRINKIPNCHLDTSIDYLSVLQNSDVLLSDFSSLLAEFFVMEKPIIYFGETDNFLNKHRKMLNSFYCVNDFNNAENIISNLQQGIDSKLDIRKNAVEEFLSNYSKTSKSIGEEIIDILISEKSKNFLTQLIIKYF